MARVRKTIQLFFKRTKFTLSAAVIYFLRAITVYKNINYYRRFFDTYGKINTQNDVDMLFLFKAYFILMTYKALLHGAFYICPLNSGIRLVLVDEAHILQISRQFNLVLLIFTLFTIFFYWSFYLRKDCTLTLIAENIIIGRRSHSLTDKFVRYDKIAFTREKFLKLAMLITNFLQLFVLFQNLCLLAFLGILWVTLSGSCGHFLFETPFNYLLFVPIFVLHLSGFLTFWCSLINMFCFLASYGLISLIYIITIFKLNYAKLMRAMQKAGSHHPLRAALRDNLHLFELLFISDAFYRNIFLVYLVVHMPSCAYYLVQVFTGKVGGLLLYVLLLLIVEGLTGSLGVHLGNFLKLII